MFSFFIEWDASLYNLDNLGKTLEKLDHKYTNRVNVWNL